MKQFFTQLLAFAALAFCLTGCGDDDKTQSGKTEAQKTTGSSQSAAGQDSQQQTEAAGFDSPEAAFAALKTAAQNDDYRAAVTCLDPESQNSMAQLITLPLAMMAAFEPDKEEDIKDLLGKHNVSTDAEEFPIDAIPDKVAYIVDIMEWLDENAQQKEGGSALTRLTEGTLGEVTIEEDTAHATVEIASGGSEDMDFQKIDGRWYVHLPAVDAFSADSEMTADEFDLQMDAIDSSMESFAPFGEEEPPMPLEAVSLDEYNQAWQVTMDVSDQPAGEVLAQLTEELGLQLETETLDGGILETPVAVAVSGGSRFEAIDAICRQIEVTPVYSGAELELVPGQQSLPVKFAGPFLVAVKQLQTDPDTATGTVEIQTFTAGLPATVMQQLNESTGATSIDDIQNPEGESVLRTPGGGGFFMNSGGLVFDRAVSYGLKRLLRDVATIDLVQGRIELTLPTSVERLEFAELKPDVAKSAGDVTLTLKEINEGEFSFEFSNSTTDAIQILAFDAEGNRVESIAGSHFGSGDSGMLTEVYENAPAKIEARVITASELLEYEFSFEGLPVPNHAEMPEKLAELTFEGPQPVSLEFVRIDREDGFPEAVFNVRNQANKDAASLSIRLVYLDADGKELDDTTSSYNESAIPVGETTEIGLTAFFMPDETQSVRAELTSAEFTDATLWQPQE